MGGRGAASRGGRGGSKPIPQSKQTEMAENASKKIGKVLDDIKKHGFSKRVPFTVGKVEDRMRQYAKENGVKLSSRNIYMTSQQIAHATRETKKTAGKVVSRSAMMGFPKKMKGMKLYYDTKKGNFVYSDGRNKFIIHPNYQLKIRRNMKTKVNFVTASKTDGREFNQKNYEKIG